MELEQLPKEEKPTGKPKHAKEKVNELKKKKKTTKTCKGTKECIPLPTSKSSSSLAEISRRIDQESEDLVTGGMKKQKSLNRLLASSPERGALRMNDEREVPPMASSPSPKPTCASHAHTDLGHGIHQDEESSSSTPARRSGNSSSSLVGEEVIEDLKGHMQVAAVKRCGPKSHSTRKVAGWKNRWIHIYRDSEGEFVLEIHVKRPVRDPFRGRYATLVVLNLSFPPPPECSWPAREPCPKQLSSLG